MASHVLFQGGPFSGIKMDAKFDRRAIEVEATPTRYPSRILVEYDSVSSEELLVNCPSAPFTAGRNTLVATYTFDEGLGLFEFQGYSTHESGSSPSPEDE